MPEITASPERLERYAEVAVATLDLNVLRAHDRLVADEVAGKFIAIADAEQAELRAEADRVERVVDGWRRTNAEMIALMNAHEALQAKVARAEALHVNDGAGYCVACPSLTLWPEECRTLAALADPERHVCPECEQGKHANCDGDAWDDAKDEPTSCTCHLHEGVS